MTLAVPWTPPLDASTTAEPAAPRRRVEAGRRVDRADPAGQRPGEARLGQDIGLPNWSSACAVNGCVVPAATRHRCRADLDRRQSLVDVHGHLAGRGQAAGVGHDDL